MTQAILFGSIGALVETSETQRAAFNEAFRAFGLDWHWGRRSYASMLRASGGQDRVAAYAASRGDMVDAKAIHAKKTELFQAALRSAFPGLRQGVADVLSFAKANEYYLGFVTSTERPTAELIASKATAETGLSFDIVTFREPSRPGKPDPAVYAYALAALGVAAQNAIAIEDNSDGVASAKAAGIQTIGFPGANTCADDLLGADCVADGDLFKALRGRMATDIGLAP